MQNENKPTHTSRPAADDAGQFRPPVTRWNLPAPRLRGTRFVGPVAKVHTVDSPIRPKKTP